MTLNLTPVLVLDAEEEVDLWENMVIHLNPVNDFFGVVRSMKIHVVSSRWFIVMVVRINLFSFSTFFIYFLKVEL